MIQVQPGQASSHGLRYGFAHNTAMGLGITHIIIGIACLALGIVTLLEKCLNYKLSVPILCGVFFIVTGGIGCISSRKKTSSTIIASMVLSILSSSLGVITMMSVEPAALEHHLRPPTYLYVGYEDHTHNTVCIGTSLALLVLTFIALVISIISSGFGCRAVCCSQGASPQMYYLVGEPASVVQEQIPMEDMPSTESLPQHDQPVENHDDSQINTDQQQTERAVNTEQSANQDE